MPLAEPPPRDSRFGVSYQGQREDKPAKQVVRPVPSPLKFSRVHWVCSEVVVEVTS